MRKIASNAGRNWHGIANCTVTCAATRMSSLHPMLPGKSCWCRSMSNPLAEARQASSNQTSLADGGDLDPARCDRRAHRRVVQFRQRRRSRNTPRSRRLQASDRRAAVRVVFSPSAQLNDINQLLRSVECDIIAGPSEAGVYTLATEHGKDVHGIIAKLREHSGVLFAEPSQTLAGTSPGSSQ